MDTKNRGPPGPGPPPTKPAAKLAATKKVYHVVDAVSASHSLTTWYARHVLLGQARHAGQAACCGTSGDSAPRSLRHGGALTALLLPALHVSPPPQDALAPKNFERLILAGIDIIAVDTNANIAAQLAR